MKFIKCGDERSSEALFGEISEKTTEQKKTKFIIINSIYFIYSGIICISNKNSWKDTILEIFF